MLLTRISKIRVNFIYVNFFYYKHLTRTFPIFALILLRVNFVRVVVMLRYIPIIRYYSEVYRLQLEGKFYIAKRETKICVPVFGLLTI